MTHALRFQTLGAYRLGDRLGLGGMAEVFAGEHDRWGRVAVKRILPGLTEDREFSDMFWDEARVTSRLDHPNIVRVLDYGRVDGQLYMALEFVNGPALSRVLRKAAKMRRPLSYAALLTIIVQVLDALNYVHNAQDERGRPLSIVHRDVSPGNIMLTKSGQAKLGDFGIVRSQTVVRRTQPGELKGKVGYMSPEQAMGEPVTKQTDVFSMGIILAEFLTLRPLFLGKNEIQTLSRTVNVDLSTWHRYNESVPVSLRSVVERALCRDVKQRFSSAGEMRDALLEVARQRGWVLDPTTVVDELCDLEFVERETDKSGQRRIVSRIPRNLFTGDKPHEETPTLVQPVGQARRPQGKPVWNVEFKQATLPSQLFLALRRARDGAIELNDGSSALLLELKDGNIVSTHDSTGQSAMGILLVEDSLISSTDLVYSIGESRQLGLKLGQYLILNGQLRESALVRILKTQLNRRLAPWLVKPSGKLAVYTRATPRQISDFAQTPSSYSQIVSAMRPCFIDSELERVLESVMDAIVLPTQHGASMLELGLTDPEVRALTTVMPEGAYEGHSVRRVVDCVSQERVARRRDALFALFIGLSAGIIQAPGFGR